MIMANMLSKYMNKQEMAEYIVNVFQNYEAYYKEHLTKFGSVLPHVFTSETINDLMKTEFEFNAQSKILINIVGLFSTFRKAKMRK